MCTALACVIFLLLRCRIIACLWRVCVGVGTALVGQHAKIALFARMNCECLFPCLAPVRSLPLLQRSLCYRDGRAQIEFSPSPSSPFPGASVCLRSFCRFLQQTTAQIFADQSLVNVEPNIASVKEIFRITDDAELVEAEDKYLP